jgi:hypothetical protein
MRSRKILVGLTCLTASTALFVETAHADRRTGLGGNLLIQDPDDLFPFPQYTLQHRNMIRLDYGTSIENLDENRGNGVITFGGKKHAVGVALHRGDLLNPDIVGFNTELAWVGGVGNPLGDTTYGAFPGPELVLPEGGVAGTTNTMPATVVDLFYGGSLGGDQTIGARFGYGRGVQTLRTDDEVTRGSSTFFVGQFGYSLLPPTGLRIDIGANLLTALGKSVVADEADNKAFEMRLAALMRGYYALNQFVDFAFLTSVSVDNERSKNLPTDEKSNDFSAGIMGGVGPAIHTERAHIAAYGGFSLGAGKNVPDTNDASQDIGRINFLSPMVNFAAEVQVLDWLFIRTGAQYVWSIDHYKGEDEDGTRKERFSGAPFTWSAGFGVTKNNFYFDGVVRNGFVTNGPNFIGGNANAGFLALASMTYKFGDVFEGASFKGTAAQPNTTPAQERVAAPPVAPAPPAPIEPEPLPEPVPEASAPGVSGDVNAATGTTDTGVSGSASGGVSVGR